MKKIKSILLIICMVFAVSCSDMYNEVSDELGAEYNYYLAVASSSNGVIRVYSLNEAGSEAEIVWISEDSTNRECGYIAAHPTGDYLYVPDSFNGQLITYNVEKGGTLLQLQSLPTGDFPSAVEIHPSGKYVYTISSSDEQIMQYSVNDDGTLSKISVVSPLLNPIPSVVSSPARFVIDPSGTYMFVAGNNALGRYKINSDGTLYDGRMLADVPTTGITDVIAGNNNHIYISSDGGIYLYDISSNFEYQTLSFNRRFHTINIWQYIHQEITYTGHILLISSCSIDADGSLTQLLNEGPESAIKEMALYPDGKYLYSSGFGA